MRGFVNIVTLNSFQGPFRRLEVSKRVEEWMLKQVQHDGEGGCTP